MMQIRILIIVCAAILFTGCKTTKPMYDYVDYSETFYAMKLEASGETETEWKSNLENIIIKSEKRNLRVPPGVYANLGYLHLKMNDETKAITYFELEKSIYPEAIHFMDRLINRVKTQS
jgi:hypothetical protein